MLVSFFYIGKHVYGWSSPIIAVLIVSLILIIITFIGVHFKTGLWRLVHTKVENLDEREIQVTHESLRYSYSILSVILLLIIFAMALTSVEKDASGMVLFASVIYLAHTLPSSIIAWRGDEMMSDEG